MWWLFVDEGGLDRYDMDFSGPLYPLSTFVRSVSNREKK